MDGKEGCASAYVSYFACGKYCVHGGERGVGGAGAEESQKLPGNMRTMPNSRVYLIHLCVMLKRLITKFILICNRIILRETYYKGT